MDSVPPVKDGEVQETGMEDVGLHRMKKKALEFLDRYFSPRLKLQDRLFYLFCVAGVFCSFFAFVAAVLSSLPPVSIVGSFFCFCVMVLLAIYSCLTVHVNRGRLVVSLGLNFFLFPVLFCISGGENSGMPFYFLLGLCVAALVLDRKLRIFVLLLSILEYSILLAIAFLYPNILVRLSGESRMSDTISSFIIVALFLCVITAVVVREYSKEHDIVQELNRRLERRSVTDDLTQLYNRRYLMQVLPDLMKRFSEYGTLSLILFDIDKFKLVNDQYGHLKGNEVLVRFSRILQEETAEKEIAVRYGGEEFILVLPRKNLEQAAAVADRIRMHTAEDALLQSIARRITISGGVAEFLPGTSMEKFIDQADSKLYEAKNGGRNQIVS